VASLLSGDNNALGLDEESALAGTRELTLSDKIDLALAQLPVKMQNVATLTDVILGGGVDFASNLAATMETVGGTLTGAPTNAEPTGITRMDLITGILGDRGASGRYQARKAQVAEHLPEWPYRRLTKEFGSNLVGGDTPSPFQEFITDLGSDPSVGQALDYIFGIPALKYGAKALRGGGTPPTPGRTGQTALTREPSTFNVIDDGVAVAGEDLAYARATAIQAELVEEAKLGNTAAGRKQRGGEDLARPKVYHGSAQDLTGKALRPGRAGLIFTSGSSPYAEQYAGPGGTTLRYAVDTKKPADLDNDPVARERAVTAFNENGGWSDNDDVMAGRKSPDFDPKQDSMMDIIDSPGAGVADDIMDRYGYDSLVFDEGTEATGTAVTYAVRDPSLLTPDPVRTGQQNAEFFSGKAKKASSTIPYVSQLGTSRYSPETQSYQKYTTDNFTGHISKMIPGFAEKQAMVAQGITRALKPGSFLDIGASEGGLAKTIGEHNPGAKVVALDPNPDMRANFDNTPAVANVDYRTEAFREGWDDIPAYKTDEKFDVINEDFTFQFMNNDRAGQIAEAG